MCIDEKKKVLLVIGKMDQKMESIIKEKIKTDPENILILQSYQPVVSPFSDLMRDIIIAVYQENADEIIVAAAEDNKKNLETIVKKINENKESQKKIQTFDYLFKYCKPEFPESEIMEWLKGSVTFTDSVHTSVNVIQNHPLIPSHVKVREILSLKAELAFF
ncbi:carbonic anhydrase [Neobacillus niacini]|uniref:carbonic anhydrase n=1 Tax=Neobacillus niacini TaxID=86668 RepID=UPI00285F1560|nr:carbonic anhydrase [Neobacillus niacini]MDR7000466.1 carbonic anhydrase [Neobacillus niacini]